MRSNLPIILLVTVIAIVYQSCDSSMNIDKPKDFYKYIGMDGDQTGVDLVTDVDGNAYILGSSKIASDTLGQPSYYGQQLYVVMTNSSGEVVWSKTYGGKGDDIPKDIELLSDGTLVVLADRSDGDFAIYRLDKTTGTETKPVVVSGLEALIGAPASDDHANTITQTTDGFIVAGYSNDGAGFKTALVARYHPDMTKFDASWSYQLNQLNELSGYDVVPIKVVQKDPGNFIIFGYTNTPGADTFADYNYFVVATGALNDARSAIFYIDADPATHSNERLSSVKQAPVQSGGGFILTGYTSSSNGATQDIYVARVVQDPQTALQETFIQGNPRTITSNLSNLSSAFVSVYPSVSSGFYVLGNQGVLGDNNLYLTKLDNDLGNAWKGNPARELGGVGDDAGGAVAETVDGRILVVGTMVLGDLKGQRKLVLMNLSSDGFFGN